MTHIIDPKTEKEFPTNVEFLANIRTFHHDIAYIAQCRHCGGKCGGHIKLRHADKLKEEDINSLVLKTLARRHACPRKMSQWGDKGLLSKIGSDILSGYDKLKELTFRNNRSGKA